MIAYASRPYHQSQVGAQMPCSAAGAAEVEPGQRAERRADQCQLEPDHPEQRESHQGDRQQHRDREPDSQAPRAQERPRRARNRRIDGSRKANHLGP
jgi:hypothetical protein